MWGAGGLPLHPSPCFPHPASHPSWGGVSRGNRAPPHPPFPAPGLFTRGTGTGSGGPWRPHRGEPRLRPLGCGATHARVTSGVGGPWSGADPRPPYSSSRSPRGPPRGPGGTAPVPRGPSPERLVGHYPTNTPRGGPRFTTAAGTPSGRAPLGDEPGVHPIPGGHPQQVAPRGLVPPSQPPTPPPPTGANPVGRWGQTHGQATGARRGAGRSLCPTPCPPLIPTLLTPHCCVYLASPAHPSPHLKAPRGLRPIGRRGGRVHRLIGFLLMTAVFGGSSSSGGSG